MSLRQQSVSHELVTPLRCITRLADTLRRENPDPQTVTKHAGFIYNTSKIVHCSVNELLDKSLLERQSLQPKNSSMSLAFLLRDTISIMETQIKHSHMQIKYTGPKTGVYVKVDEIRV